MRRYLEVRMGLSVVAMTVTAPVFAQSSVTLYGIIDTGFGYQSSQTTLGSTSGGHSAVKIINGVWAGSRFGLKGTEDLGGGTKAVFQLEEGFNSATGAQSVNGLMFNRQAFVGVTNERYGALTAGRQYASYYQLLAPYSPVTWLSGFYGAHPGDLDGLDTIYRTNNTIEYMSPSWYGLKVSASYSLAGVPGSVNQGSTWAAGLQYTRGAFGVAAAFSRINNSTRGGGAFGADSATSNAGAQTGVSAVTNGYQTAQAQQRFAVGAGYTINSQFDVTATASERPIHPGRGLGVPRPGDLQYWRDGAALEGGARVGLRCRLQLHALRKPTASRAALNINRSHCPSTTPIQKNGRICVAGVSACKWSDVGIEWPQHHQCDCDDRRWLSVDAFLVA